MALKKKSADNGFALFNVLYEDGTRASNRKVPRAEIDTYAANSSALALIEAQDRKIAAMSGKPRGPIKSITRLPGT